MDFSSEMVCRVALPPSLPPMDHLAKLEGSILLHSAEPSEQGIALEGDLLWRGFFPDDSGMLQCLWEGAEFFRETFSTEGMKRGDDLTISPSVRSVTGEVKDDDTYELRFSIHWWEVHIADDGENISSDIEAESQEERQAEDETVVAVSELTATEDLEAEEEARESSSDVREEEEIMDIKETKEVIEKKEQKEEREQLISGYNADEFDKEIEAIDNTFRETIKVLEEEPVSPISQRLQSPVEAAEEIQPPAASKKPTEPAPEEAKSSASKCEGSYCLRYYRAQPGDSLDAIAERLSVSLARMREINELDEIGIVDVGDSRGLENRMIRVE